MLGLGAYAAARDRERAAIQAMDDQHQRMVERSHALRARRKFDLWRQVGYGRPHTVARTYAQARDIALDTRMAYAPYFAGRAIPTAWLLDDRVVDVIEVDQWLAPVVERETPIPVVTR